VRALVHLTGLYLDELAVDRQEVFCRLTRGIEKQSLAQKSETESSFVSSTGRKGSIENVLISRSRPMSDDKERWREVKKGDIEGSASCNVIQQVIIFRNDARPRSCHHHR